MLSRVYARNVTRKLSIEKNIKPVLSARTKIFIEQRAYTQYKHKNLGNTIPDI
jgi:hypothetical protein